MLVGLIIWLKGMQAEGECSRYRLSKQIENYNYLKQKTTIFFRSLLLKFQ